MALGLQLRVAGPAIAFERAFPRTPVSIGRDRAAHCVLRDEKVSKVHAWIDVQQGSIYVRDVGSVNGTFVRGHRLEKNRWIPVGSTSNPVELHIAGFTLQAAVYDVGERSHATLAESLMAYLPGGELPRAPPARAEKDPAALLGGTYDMGGPITRIVGPYAAVVAATQALGSAIDRELEKAPPTAQQIICEQLVAMYPDLANDPRLRAMMRRRGWTGPAADGAGQNPMATAALDALQDLAGWYVDNRALSDPASIVRFKENLRATLDEFLLGYVPLLTGLGTFEEQMAIQPATARMAASPAGLANELLDWRKDAAAVRARLRTSFSELMMHQIALLNGVMSGVKALLSDLSPAAIEKAAGSEKSRRKGLSGIFSRLDPWAMYKKRHGDLADEENERFRVLFGKEFVDEYRQFTREGSPDNNYRSQASEPQQVAARVSRFPPPQS